MFRYFSWKEILLLAINSLAYRLKTRVPRSVTERKELVSFLLGKNVPVHVSPGEDRVEYPVDNKRVTVFLRKNTSDHAVFNQIMVQGEYAFLRTLLPRLHTSVERIIDAGANIGLTTLFLKTHFPEAAVFCIEPSSKNHDRLKKHIRENSLAGVSVFHGGLWPRKATLKASRFRDGRDWSYSVAESPDGDIQTVTVNEITEQMGWTGQTIDFFKIDIEGSEKVLFREDPVLDAWLAKTKIIALEIHDEYRCRNSINQKLESLGFRLFYEGELTIGLNTALLSVPAGFTFDEQETPISEP